MHQVYSLSLLPFSLFFPQVQLYVPERVRYNAVALHSATFQLGDFGQVSSPLCASVPMLAK